MLTKYGGGWGFSEMSWVLEIAKESCLSRVQHHQGHMVPKEFREDGSS